MPVLFFILVISLYLCTIWFVNRIVLYKIKINNKLKSVPMVDGEWPVIGHIPSFKKKKYGTAEQLHSSIVEILDAFGEEARLWLGTLHVLGTAKPSTLERILMNSETVGKGYFYEYYDGSSSGVALASTNKWRKIRKRLNMTFNPRFLNHYIDQMNYQSSIFINVLHSKVNNSRGDEELYIVDALPLLSQYFFDTISSTHLGINTKQQFSDKPNAVQLLSRLQMMVLTRLMQPLLQPNYLFKRSKLYQDLRQVTKPLISTFRNLSVASEQYQTALDENQNGLPGWKSYSVHCKEFLEEQGQLNPSPYSVGKTMIDLIIAGSDTSTVATSTILYHLGLHPEYQELAYKEIMELYNDDERQINICFDKQDPIKYNESEWESTKFFPEGYGVWTRGKMDKLEYVEMLVKEAVRLTGPPAIMRNVPQDLECDDFTIPGGTDVAVLIRSIHRNPQYYEKPNEFYPDHFTKENIQSRPKMAFIPFSAGPRDCPGKVFGMYAMKCVLAEIIRNYIIVTDPPPEPVQYKLFFTIEHSKGYPIKLISRQK